VIGVGWPAGARGGAIAGWFLTLFPADVGTQSIDLIDIASGGAPEMSQNGRRGECDWGSAVADRHPDSGPGNHRLPPSDAAGQSVDVAGR